MNTLLTGREGGHDWRIEVKPTFGGRFFAIVTVGGKVQRTHVVYRTEEAAKEGGRYLLARTLAALGVGVCHAC